MAAAAPRSPTSSTTSAYLRSCRQREPRSPSHRFGRRLGRDQIPIEIRTIADLPKLADALADANFPDDAIRDVWRELDEFFKSALPQD